MVFSGNQLYKNFAMSQLVTNVKMFINNCGPILELFDKYIVNNIKYIHDNPTELRAQYVEDVTSNIYYLLFSILSHKRTFFTMKPDVF